MTQELQTEREMIAALWRCRDGRGYPCPEAGTVRLVSPNGWRGGPMCETHAQEVINEYASKLGEAWTVTAY